MRITSILLLLIFACSTLNAAQKHIALLVKHNFRGEISFAHRIQAACKNIQWEADIINIENHEKSRKKKYDFVISLVPGIYKYSHCKKYLAIFHPRHHYFNKNGLLKNKYSSYNGYLLTYSPDALSPDKKSFSESNRPYMLWYPTVQRRAFQTVDPSHLFYICCSWGNRFSDKKFQQALKKLDNESFTRFYGNPLFEQIYPRSYQGEIPYDSISIQKIAAEAGVALILHSSDHNKYGLPTGRIFEALAASAVIICDENAFVLDNFGDSILYINTNENGKSIYKQIKQHMDWIRANKSAALAKAKRAHSIYEKKFLLEDQLLQLGEFHDRLSNKP